MLRLEDLSVRFGGLTAVNTVSLSVGSHEVVGLVLVVMIIASPDGLLGLFRKFMRKKDAAA